MPKHGRKGPLGRRTRHRNGKMTPNIVGFVKQARQTARGRRRLNGFTIEFANKTNAKRFNQVQKNQAGRARISATCTPGGKKKIAMLERENRKLRKSKSKSKSGTKKRKRKSAAAPSPSPSRAGAVERGRAAGARAREDARRRASAHGAVARGRAAGARGRNYARSSANYQSWLNEPRVTVTRRQRRRG